VLTAAHIGDPRSSGRARVTARDTHMRPSRPARAASGEVERIKTVALCHPSCTTNGRTCPTVAGSHEPYGSRRELSSCPALLSLPVSFCLTRIVSHSLATNASRSSSLSLSVSLSLFPCLSLFLSLAVSSTVCISHGTLLATTLLQASLRRSWSLCLSISPLFIIIQYGY